MRVFDSDGNVRSDMSDREAMGASVKVAVAFVAVIAVVSLVWWLTAAGLAPWTGRVQQQHIINDPHNQIAQYQQFFTLDADIKAESQKIRNAAGQLTAFDKANPPGTPDPTGQIAEARNQLQSTVTGIAGNCATNVTKYNAMAAQYTTQQFRDAALPATEDQTLCEAPNA